MNRLTEFHQAYINAVAQIERFKSDPIMAPITNWILTPETNLYSVFSSGWGNIYSANDCETLLNTICHALIDDGDISFPVVNGEPRIALLSRWEDNFRNIVLSTSEREFAERFNRPIVITFLDSIDEFIVARSQWDIAQLKRHFVVDAARRGIEVARNHYKTVTDEQAQSWQIEIDEYSSKLKSCGILK